jgi:5-methylcytosine-specific restriction endonuclease McrA
LSRWSRLADSRRYRRALGEIQAAGPTCVLCGHPGSDSIHHLVPPSRFPHLAIQLATDPANWAPAHGVKGCMQCGQRCNQVQGNSLTPKRSPRSRRW